MYTVTVPVMLHGEKDNEAALQEVLRAGADRVLLISNRTLAPSPDGLRLDLAAATAGIAEWLPRFRAAGLKTGVWIGQTIGHGMSSTAGTATDDPRGGYAYSPFVSIGGASCFGSFCCADERFCEDVCRWAATLAQMGAGLILLDDDFRMTSHGDHLSGCLCDAHLKRYCELVGEDLTREEVARRVFTGAGSRYRDCWQQLMGGDLLRLARRVRAAVDAVDPTCRVGICAVHSTIDVDGVSLTALADAFAGNTRPYLRLIGAPYWAKDGAVLAGVITTERMEAKFVEEWQKTTGAEVLLEGDVYPRPRFACPAAYLEAADQITRADGRFTGAMKYMLDYTAVPRYEHGYIDAAVRNAALSRQIGEMFVGKRQCGLRPFEYPHLFKDSVLNGTDVNANNAAALDRSSGTALRSLAYSSMPVSFDDGVPVVFGENARHVPIEAIAGGAILDAAAAEILTARGIDVGVAAFGDVIPGGSCMEHDHRQGQDVSLYVSSYVRSSVASLRELTPKAAAVVESEIDGCNCPVFTYENADGARFAVLPVIAAPADEGVYFRNYLRQRQLIRFAEWIGRAPLTASVCGHPNAYLLTAKDERETAVGLWNLFEDTMLAPRVTLACVPQEITFINCTGRVEGRTVILSDVRPFAFAGFTYKEGSSCTL